MNRSSMSAHWSTASPASSAVTIAPPAIIGTPQTSVICATLPFSPRQHADDVVVEVELPVGVLLGGLRGEVGASLEVARRAARTLGEGDEPEQLVAGRRPCDRGHVRAPAPAAIREPGDLARLAEIRVLGVELRAGGREVMAERVGPAAIRDGLLGRLGRERDDEPLDGGHAAIILGVVRRRRAAPPRRCTFHPRGDMPAAQTANRRRAAQYAPRRDSTAGIVFSRIERSSSTDQRSR